MAKCHDFDNCHLQTADWHIEWLKTMLSVRKVLGLIFTLVK